MSDACLAPQGTKRKQPAIDFCIPPQGLKVSGGSGFSPSDIADMIAWYDAALGITLNTADVSAWEDQSGNSNDLAQTDATEQPLYNASDSDFNNLPSLEFDGVTEEIFRQTWTQGTITQPVTVFCVFKSIVNTDGAKIFDRGPGAGSFRLHIGFGTVFRMVAPSNGPNVSYDTDTHVIACEYDTTNAMMFMDGGGNTSGPFTCGTNDSNGITFAALQNGTGNQWNGKIAEFINYEGVLSDADKNLVGNYLAGKYGTTWTDI